MVWINFDWFVWMAEQECKKLDSTVAAIYHTAHRHLSDAHDAEVKEGEASDLDPADMGNYLEWLDEEFRGQTAALASMTLALLAQTISSYLKTIMKWPAPKLPETTPIQGRGLARIVSEYRSRLGIGIDTITHYATLVEVVLARNDFIHNEGKPKEYLQQSQRRFIDLTDQLNLNPLLVDAVIAELKQFVTAVGKRMSDELKQRTPKPPAPDGGPGSRSSFER